jgi:hypothetical protein
MPIWFPAAYMNAPVNICIQRIFCRDSMGPEMPWTVWQMDSTFSQASREFSSWAARSEVPRSPAWTAPAGRLRSTDGVEISVTLRQSVWEEPTLLTAR